MSAEVERISRLFKNVNLGRRGSDASSAKTFHLKPNVIYPQPHRGLGGMTSSLAVPRDHREGSPGFGTRSCQLHVPGIGDRRGSTGALLWKKASSPASQYSSSQPHASSSHLTSGIGPDMPRRGSTPGDILLFPKKESRKFSQDSIDLNEPVGNHTKPLWESTSGVILEENEPIGNQSGKPKFMAVTTLEDAQAIRTAEFHPRGHVYAIGSNSKTLRICSYPETAQKLSKNHVSQEPIVLYKRNKYHRGSIYCLSWSPDGNLLATGSNDKSVKLARFDDTRKDFGKSDEIELTMHDGTVRDICFIEDLSNKSSLLVSGGAGDCKIYVTDCLTSTPFQAFPDHSAPVLSLYNWGGVMFASGSQDKTIRLWDLRTCGCVNMVSPITSPKSTTIKSPVGSVSVDPTGRLLVSGHEDGAIVLFDIRGNRQIQTFKSHAADVKSVRFSPNAYYLLSAGYDQRLMLTDLQGDLSLTLSSIVVASHSDRVISGRWHPTDFSFLSTSADKTATLWALPAPN